MEYIFYIKTARMSHKLYFYIVLHIKSNGNTET